jgi:hypothetical protein
MRRAILAGLVGCAFGVSAPVGAQTFIGNFDDWSAFHDGTGRDKTCYIASLPKKTLPTNVQRGKSYVLVTHRPGEKVRNVFELRAGYPYKEGSDVEVAIDGNKPFKLFTNEASAWAADAATDGALAEAMRKGRAMVIIGVSARGTKTTDTYSLTGFSAAHGAIDKECK